jgi:hypothetical protein
MTTFLTPTPKQQFFTAGGVPLVGGKLYTYAAGTSTPLATYQDFSGVVSNTNPVILDSRGEANVWLSPSDAYKFVLTDSADALIWTVDNINIGINFGTFIPVNNLSLMNMAMKVGRRGTANNGLIREAYFNFTLGFSLNDNSWFYKQVFE